MIRLNRFKKEQIIYSHTVILKLSGTESQQNLSRHLLQLLWGQTELFEGQPRETFPSVCLQCPLGHQHFSWQVFQVHPEQRPNNSADSLGKQWLSTSYSTAHPADHILFIDTIGLTYFIVFLESRFCDYQDNQFAHCGLIKFPTVHTAPFLDNQVPNLLSDTVQCLPTLQMVCASFFFFFL